MATIVKLPQLGESIAEGTIGRWLKQPGERIERDEPLVEVQTDKVNAEVPSPVAGVLQQILQPEGATVPVQTDIAVIGEGEPGGGGAATPAPVAAAAASGAGAGPASPADGALPTPSAVPVGSSGAGAAGANAATPLAQGPEGVNPRKSDQAAAASAPGQVAPGGQVATPSFSYDTTPGRGGVVSSAADEMVEAGGDGSVADEARRSSTTASTSTAAPAPSQPSPDQTGRRFYTPVVLRMAQEHGLDLQAVQGTGLGGRVTRRDLERLLAQGPASLDTAAVEQPAAADAGAAPSPRPLAGQPLAASTQRSPVAATPQPPPAMRPTPGAAPVERPLTPMRRAIASHMARARADIPDAWSLVEIDMTALVRKRAEAQAAWQAREGYELTFLPFFVRAVVAGLRAVPELNATWKGESIAIHQQYNLGIAVSVEGGLVVPVLRDADQYSVAGVARALRALVQKARSHKLQPEDLQGATFTVNNPGALGSVMSQPIVPVGQSGIVTMEAIVKRPVVTVDDAIAVRSMMYSCLSFDHRVLDGAQALHFLRTLKGELESAELSIY